jgi:hypothetical protein
MVLVALKANKTMRKRAEQLLGKRLNEYFISGHQLKNNPFSRRCINIFDGLFKKKYFWRYNEDNIRSIPQLLM